MYILHAHKVVNKNQQPVESEYIKLVDELDAEELADIEFDGYTLVVYQIPGVTGPHGFTHPIIISQATGDRLGGGWPTQLPTNRELSFHIGSKLVTTSHICPQCSAANLQLETDQYGKRLICRICNFSKDIEVKLLADEELSPRKYQRRKHHHDGY